MHPGIKDSLKNDYLVRIWLNLFNHHMKNLNKAGLKNCS